MAGKHFTTIDFLIDGIVFYSRKSLINTASKPSVSALVIVFLKFFQGNRRKRRYPERSVDSSAPQSFDSPFEKSDEEMFDPNEEKLSSNDPDYEQVNENGNGLTPAVRSEKDLG